MKALPVVPAFLAAAMVASLATAAVAQNPPAAPAAAPEAAKAPEPPAGVTPVVAAIPFQQAAFQTEEGKRILAELKKKYDPKQAALKTQFEGIQGLEKQLNDPAAKFTDAEKAERKKAIETKKAQFEREAQAAQQESQKDFNNAWKPLAEKFYKSVVEEAKERGVAMLVDAGTPEHPVIWAADWEKPVDLSGGAIERYNKAQAAAPAAPVTPAAPPAAPVVPAQGAVTK
jgi:Skp family chaperone for outer membrane proteins